MEDTPKNCGEFLRSVDVVYNELLSQDNLGQKAADFFRQFSKYEELLMSQVVQVKALTKLLVEKGILTKEEFLEMVKVVNREMEGEKGGIS
jgi:uncharacterized protein YqgQ